MYVWSENVAGRGGQEIGSAIVKHLKAYLGEEREHVILFSDRCGGQNRNIKLTMLLKKFLSSQNSLKTITQKYFVSGHSFNSCDRSFAVIEKAKSTSSGLFTPDEWIQLIRDAKKADPKFVVTKMESADFFSSSDLQSLIINRKKDVEGKKVNWLGFTSIKYSKDELFSLTVNTRTKIDIRRESVDEAMFGDHAMELLFPNGRTIDEKKYKDLLDLLRFIPSKYHEFYKNLRYNSKTIDLGLASGSDTEEDV